MMQCSHARRLLVQERRYPWMRGDLLPAGPSSSSSAEAAAQQLPPPPSAEQQEAVWQALYALHAVYEVWGLLDSRKAVRHTAPCNCC